MAIGGEIASNEQYSRGYNLVWTMGITRQQCYWTYEISVPMTEERLLLPDLRLVSLLNDGTEAWKKHVFLR